MKARTVILVACIVAVVVCAALRIILDIVS